ncbi:alpha-ketoacid dehydrogenase subunit beta, partial [Bacillus cereus]|nr:alpha-ketoacid dehydrogenase subunit beta [Bacillus cereus]
MTRTVSISTAINEAMKISMRLDENVIFLVEDVAGGEHVVLLQDDEAWGGVLGVTKGIV